MAKKVQANVDQPQGGFRKPIRTGDFILHTLSRGPDYISHMHSLYTDELFYLGVKNGRIVPISNLDPNFLITALQINDFKTARKNVSRRRSHPYRKTTYHSFEMAVQKLKREGKIELDHETVSDNPKFQNWPGIIPLRRWYRLASGVIPPVVKECSVIQSKPIVVLPIPAPIVEEPEELIQQKPKIKRIETEVSLPLETRKKKEKPDDKKKSSVIKDKEKKKLVEVKDEDKKATTKKVKAKKVVAEVIDTEPDGQGFISKEQFKVIIEEGKGVQDETKKKSSISRLETILDKIPEDQIDTSEVRAEMEAYDEIEREGLTPEEYADEKLEAFNNIWEEWDNLEFVKGE